MGFLEHGRHCRIGAGQDHPKRRTKMVQPFEIGVVRAIRVHDGQTVKAGDVLVELDPTINMPSASIRRATWSRRSSSRQAARGAGTGPDPLASFEPPDGASPALVATQRHILLDQNAEQRPNSPR